MTESTAPAPAPSPSAPPRSTPGWRFLFWFFAAIGLATAGAILWIAFMLSGGMRVREPAVVAGKNPGTSFIVGDVSPVSGTGLIAIEIEARSERSGMGSIKPGYSADIRNILLLDRSTGQSRRILPDNNTRIAERLFLPAEAQTRFDRLRAGDARGDGKSPLAYFALLLERGSDEQKSYDLLVGTLANGKQGVVMKGLSGVQQTAMIDDRRVGLIVREGGRLYYRTVDIPAQKLLESNPIAIE